MNPAMNLDVMLLNNPLSAWLTALAVALAINLAVGVIKWLMIARLSVMAKRTGTQVDDALIEVVRSTRQILVFGVTLFVGTRYLQLPDPVSTWLKYVAGIAALLQVALWANRTLDFWLGVYRARSQQTDVGATTSLAALAFIGRVLVWSIVMLVALDNFGVDVTALVAGLGIGGIAVALAVQNVLGDLFASLSIVIDKPFVIGDFIIVDDYMGSVEHVGLKTTRIRSLGGEQIVFSNSDLLKARLRNYKRMRERRNVFAFGLTYQTSAEQIEGVLALVRKIIEDQPLTRFDRVHFAKFGESSLDFEVVFWMTDPDFNKYMDTQQAINLAMLRGFAGIGVGFAFPTRSLFVESPLTVARPAQPEDRSRPALTQ
jgi:small-conductance mechanosensitive channel